jgi:hypothetical protein
VHGCCRRVTSAEQWRRCTTFGERAQAEAVLETWLTGRIQAGDLLAIQTTTEALPPRQVTPRIWAVYWRAQRN